MKTLLLLIVAISQGAPRSLPTDPNVRGHDSGNRQVPALFTTRFGRPSPIDRPLARAVFTPHVQGIVRDRHGQPAAARVVVIPKPALRSNPMQYKRTVTTAETGQFALTNLAPGEYKIFAWEALPSGAEENAGVGARYESRGRMITIEPNRRIIDLVLDLITNEPR